MRVLVLGSAAGGGFPQWNCRCGNCRGLREGTLRGRARTQSSIALSADGERWLLVNASPDIRQQLTDNRQLWPRAGVRHTPLAGVLLTDGQVDHVSGLLTLREGCPMDLFCTPSVREELSGGFPLLDVLSHWDGGFSWHGIPESAGQVFRIPALAPLEFEVVPLTSNAPPYSARRDNPRPGDNIGLLVRDPRNEQRLFYAPGLGVVDDLVWNAMGRADCLLVDGTCWADDDLRRAGAGSKKARAMGHLPLDGDGGLLSVLADLAPRRRILTHINNTNPVLDEDSPEAAQLSRMGIEVSFDGMEVQL